MRNICFIAAMILAASGAWAQPTPSTPKGNPYYVSVKTDSLTITNLGSGLTVNALTTNSLVANGSAIPATGGISTSVGGANPYILPLQWAGNPVTASIASGGNYTLDGGQFNSGIQQVSSWMDNNGTEHAYPMLSQVQVHNTRGTTTFTGSVSGTNMTVTSGTPGSIVKGLTLSGGSIPALTTVVSQTSGTAGGNGVYVITNSVSVGSEIITGTYAGYGWGFTSICNNSGIGSQCVGEEIDYGIISTDAGQQAIGLAINADGTTGSNTNIGLNFSSLGAGGVMNDAIAFTEYGGIGIYTNALLVTFGAPTPTHLIDFSSALPTVDSLKLPGGFVVDKSGNVTAKAYTAGASAGVSCDAGTFYAATAVVTNGIVTNCGHP